MKSSSALTCPCYLALAIQSSNQQARQISLLLNANLGRPK